MRCPTLHHPRTWAAPFAAALLLSACGVAAGDVTAPPVTATPAQTEADADVPTMVMLPLLAVAKPSTDLRITAGRAVMIMAVSRDGRPHMVRSGVPVTGFWTEDAGATTVAPLARVSAPGFDVPVAADHEIDMSFVPDTPGRYPIEDGGTQLAVLVVTGAAG